MLWSSTQRQHVVEHTGCTTSAESRETTLASCLPHLISLCSVHLGQVPELQALMAAQGEHFLHAVVVDACEGLSSVDADAFVRVYPPGAAPHSLRDSAEACGKTVLRQTPSPCTRRARLRQLRAQCGYSRAERDDLLAVFRKFDAANPPERAGQLGIQAMRRLVGSGLRLSLPQDGGMASSTQRDSQGDSSFLSSGAPQQAFPDSSVRRNSSSRERQLQCDTVAHVGKKGSCARDQLAL